MKPVIGIVSDLDVEKDGYVCLANYVRAIEKAGALPVILPYTNAESVSSVLELLSGVVLSGGGDFPAELYGANPHSTLQAMIPARDTFEFALARSALEKSMPILGICRGMQLLNVVSGGAIYPHTLDELPDARDHRDGTPLSEMVHKVHIEPNTKLSRLCGEHAAAFEVNSMHHQAISRLAPGFVVSARADDGVVEAIEATDRPFVVGVQWHPEWMVDTQPACLSLLENFTKACATR
ncbi:gamma-glutamyl-gamma-aminobutyrate hydrolase family protein [Mesorhizobium japonicum]|uniref:gamma-glutamyl-gamma-aminobutyrate hydrolase n=1 Tax=Mesorhizobium japonicum (strain LMG 29417 / CECT 9101 / MAFF 303099) TaxID=266835 RepID=Q989W9_RHILO|nr:gamma-glutamyl-gamma-aminobutyrate hydrolase family protein [Mesorhizobium japonicum]BAB52575.1 mll8760 [Mesorhizobium japonicum MAFF 303099]